MTTRWSSDDEIGSGGIFETLHSGLTVALIATARETLMTCCLSESLSDVVSRSAGQQYDYLPVENDERSEIVGLLHALDFAQDSPCVEIVMGRYRPLSEGDLIGADASISAKGDGFVDDLLFTQFCDKRDILIKSFPFSRKKKFRCQLKDIEKLRDRLAHANEYAATREDAQKVCEIVQNLLELRDKIKNKYR